MPYKTLGCFRRMQNTSEHPRMLQKASTESVRMHQEPSECNRRHQDISEAFRMPQKLQTASESSECPRRHQDALEAPRMHQKASWLREGLTANQPLYETFKLLIWAKVRMDFLKEASAGVAQALELWTRDKEP